MEKAINKTRIGILVVAYNAVTTLTEVLNKIPSDVLNEIEEIVVFDDASHDDTYILAQGYKVVKKLENLHIFKNPKNLGYGGNQKQGFKYFIDKGFDVIVLLHGDGQYAPEIIKNIYQPIVDGKADIVFGSRITKEYGGPLKGGMPLYKYIGNRILTTFENTLLDMNLSEFHSGYRAYNCHSLKNISFQTCSNDFHFDTEIIVKLNHHRYRMLEVPIPTYYGKEICYVNGIKYAYNVVRTVINYKLSILGIKNTVPYIEYFKNYPLREHKYSSHDLIAKYVGRDKIVLDLGCSAGYLSAKIKASNNFVCGIDIEKSELIKNNFDEFLQIDLEKNDRFNNIELSKYDVIICADVIEHLKNPADLLNDIRKRMRQDARVILSVPNVANILIRLLLMFGKFPYSDFGVLDKSHIRFFTFSTIKNLIINNGFKIVNVKATPIPFTLFLPDILSNIYGGFSFLFFKLTNLFKKLLGYQFVFVLVPENE